MTFPILSEGSRRSLLVALAIAIMVLLFYLGGKPFAAGLIPSPWDKLAHFVVYGAMAALLRQGIPERPSWLLVLAVGVVGSLDEWHQMSVPGRSADLADLLTDVIAAVYAIGTCEYWTACRSARRGVAATPPGMQG